MIRDRHRRRGQPSLKARDGPAPSSDRRYLAEPPLEQLDIDRVIGTVKPNRYARSSPESWGTTS
jgi:hypothetical protein